MKEILLSSTGQGVKLRIKALIPIIVPVINNLGESFGINLFPENIDAIVDAVFLLLGVGMHVWGWIRAKISRPES